VVSERREEKRTQKDSKDYIISFFAVFWKSMAGLQGQGLSLTLFFSVSDNELPTPKILPRQKFFCSICKFEH
jgi:hypothetical protein